MAGKVWLVGAGPSGAELLTSKAKKVIEQADAVVYDALIGQSVLDIIPETAEKIYVGKRAGHHSMPQEEINRLLLSLARQGKRTVRLKGGDPFLFGRGGEELELLWQHQIPFEVVPGVTSATAVPAYFGIPVTHRGLASSVHIITGHQKENEPLRINYQALTEAGGTLVFLMGTKGLHNIAIGLLKAGMNPDMPAAILQRGVGGGQKKISGTLSTLEQEAERQGVLTPAVIVVGEVVRLGERFGWYERLPLFGRKYIVTRPRERIGALSDRLRELGAEVAELPAIETVGIHPNAALRAELAHLEDYRFLVFTSPAGVAEFMRELFDTGRDVRYLNGVSIAAIGSGTAGALGQYGILADLVPAVYSGRALGALLAERCDAGDRVLLARSDIGNPELVTEIQKDKKVVVIDVPVYITQIAKRKNESGETVERNPVEETGRPEKEIREDRNVSTEQEIRAGGNIRPEQEMKAERKDRTEQNMEADRKRAQTDLLMNTDGVFFTSASTVRGFAAGFSGRDFSEIQAFCIGEMTAREAEKFGMKVHVAKQATVESLVKLVLAEQAAGEGVMESAFAEWTCRHVRPARCPQE